MLLLKLSAQDLLTLHERQHMVPHLAARWRHFRHAKVSVSERSAWAESLISLANDLVDADRGNVEMVVECAATTAKIDRPPLIDVVLVGRHPQENRPSVQLVELKRWSTVTRIEQATADFVDVPGMGKKKHPTLQLHEHFLDFTGKTGPFQGMEIECGGFAYLHNATQDSVRPLIEVDAPTGAYARVYTGDQREELFHSLRRSFDAQGGAAEAEAMLRSMGLRNTPLLDAMIRSRGADTVFTLRGRQKEAADQILEKAEKAIPGDKRVVFLVTGGPGTGKSAIGLQVKKELEAQGRTVKYASGSQAFNGALREHVGYGDGKFKKTFTSFKSFVTTPDPPLDVLICDEAHRLCERSKNKRDARKSGTRPQVDELLDASRLSVFFLDERQSVRPDEVGTADLIRDAAHRYGAQLATYDLREQFRCGGSDAYIRWVHALLGLSEDAPERWRPDGLMHVEVADTPQELEQIIRTEVEAGASARMVAGYCWPWNNPQGKEKRLEADVRIGDWHRPWNAKGETFCADGAPPSRIWAVNDGGLGQIGCIYTAQGLEWDWCGVIMGEDMVRRGGKWEFRRGKKRKEAPESKIWRVAQPGSFDPDVKASGVGPDEFALLVRQAYHVLMTRGSRATVLYSTDEETRAHLKEQVGPVEIHGLRPTMQNRQASDRRARENRPNRRGGEAGKSKGQSPDVLF
ncbi:DUF2075 domain-containing protein [Streptomyces sp. NPDC088097]|uniref:DUF2075 domain-containing protein n=1 Tax=Streptomyces sp. NPDC088097 TaxID=3365823 RepID=UPI003800000E